MDLENRIPQALKQRHDDLRAKLAAAASEPGALGEAARKLAGVLEPHFDKEEQLVYPSLACLPDAVEARLAPDVAAVTQAARHLREALPEMLAEHHAIREGLEKLRSTAEAASRPTHERFADSLIDHIEAGEEVLYLAAILVGEYMALRLECQDRKAQDAMLPRDGPGRRLDRHESAALNRELTAWRQQMNPKLKMPAPLKSEHDELRAVLTRAGRESGDMGVAARAVAALLQPHIAREEQFALLPLGLLEALARGEVTPDMDEALVLIDRLSDELPDMLNDHNEIVAALQKLLAAARAGDKVEYAEFAEHLLRHIQMEERVLYPAAILAGRYLRLKLGLGER